MAKHFDKMITGYLDQGVHEFEFPCYLLSVVVFEIGISEPKCLKVNVFHSITQKYPLVSHVLLIQDQHTIQFFCLI